LCDDVRCATEYEPGSGHDYCAVGSVISILTARSLDRTLQGFLATRQTPSPTYFHGFKANRQLYSHDILMQRARGKAPLVPWNVCRCLARPVMPASGAEREATVAERTLQVIYALGLSASRSFTLLP